MFWRKENEVGEVGKNSQVIMDGNGVVLKNEVYDSNRWNEYFLNASEYQE